VQSAKTDFNDTLSSHARAEMEADELDNHIAQIREALESNPRGPWLPSEALLVAMMDEIDRLRAIPPVAAEQVAWETMASAPLNGKHVLLAVPDGAFVWTVEGSFDGKDWNAVHASKVRPLYWMPKPKLPDDWIELRAALSKNGKTLTQS
jgi:hypothetical protein